ncbi:unnamed protein product, partial [Rotaria sordida]
TNIPSSSSVQMSPPSAMRSIISTYLHDKNRCTSSTPTKTNSRIRVERKYGENITDGNLLQELKKKAEMRTTKATNRKPAQQPRNPRKKKS